MNNVLVIGAGARAQGAVLPALACLEREFRIAAVRARSVRELSYGAPPRTIQTIDSWQDFDFSAIDLIVVAVATTQVPVVLAELAQYPVAHAVLLVDTPVLRPGGLWAARYFSKFKRVLVSEDNLALPPFVVARRLIDEGAIGRLKHITFFQNGFKHHAIASLKFLTNSSVTSIVDRRMSGKKRKKRIRFASGVTATMFEPRDYSVGKFLIEGDDGCIADFDHPGERVRRIGYLRDGDIYRGLTLDGEALDLTELDQAYLDSIAEDVPGASLMNTMKLRGLMEIVQASVLPESPLHYDPYEALSDYLSIRMVNKTRVMPAVGHLPSILRLARLMPDRSK